MWCIFTKISAPVVKLCFRSKIVKELQKLYEHILSPWLEIEIVKLGLRQKKFNVSCLLLFNFYPSHFLNSETGKPFELRNGCNTIIEPHR